jgi:hypothetical protein
MRTFLAIVLTVSIQPVLAEGEKQGTPRLLRAEDLPTNVEPEALQRQYQALTAISAERLEYSPRGPVQTIQGVAGVTLPTRVRNLAKGHEAADTILPVVGDMLLARGVESLTVQKNAPIDESTRALRLSQSIRGIPVINGGIAIDYDPTTLRISGMTANFVPDRGLPQAPRLSAKDAEQIVPPAVASVDNVKDIEVAIQPGTYLAYYAKSVEPDPPQLVWVVQVTLGTSHELFFINAISGEIAGRQKETYAGRDSPSV